jgi:long-chain fatty acid transport protein
VPRSWRHGARLSRHGLFVCGALSVLLAVDDAAASPLFDIAGGVGDQGGFQGRTVEGGASAAYYNPALLVDAEAGVSAGFFVLGTDINISYAARPGAQYNVPNLANATYPGGGALPSAPLPTNLLQNGAPASGGNPAIPARPRGSEGTGHQTFSYDMIGLVVKLFEDRLALGVYGLIPNGNFTALSEFYPDEREQYFSNSLHPELYGDRLLGVSFAFGAGYKISDALSIGAGATLSLAANGVTPVFVPNADDLGNLLIDSNIKVDAGLAPHFGVSYKPGSRWRVTGTAHAPSQLKIIDEFTFTLAGGQGSKSTITFVHDYMPWQFGAGASYDIAQEKHDTLTVAVSGLLGLWSTYVDRTGETPDEETGGIPAYGWCNTISPTAGVRYQHDDVGTFLDATYVPTPVPLQTGRSNYVDNDRVGTDLGANYTFTLLHTTMRVGAQFELQRLIPRAQAKLPTPNEPDGLDHYPALVRDEAPDNAIGPSSNGIGTAPLGTPVQGLQTNNPGWPGFGSEGWVVGGGVYLSVIP